MREPVRVGSRRGQRHGAAPRYGSRRLVCAGFAASLAATVAVLIGLAYLIGSEPNIGLGGGVRAILSTVSSPAVSVALASFALLVAAACIRRLLYEWLAWSPGHIDVADFKAARENLGADPAWLTALFRTRLAQLSLQAPNPAPGAAPESAFLDVLGQGSLDPRNPADLLRLMRAAVPSHAYEVRGTLETRPRHRDRCGVVAQVVRLPHVSSVPITVWAPSWELAIRRAADAATAAILPRTRLCRRQWVSWRRYVMPKELLIAYEQAFEEEQEEHYPEALEHYYDAIDEDPFNLAIRLQIGQLLEKMGRLLDAFSTYQGIITVTRPAGAKLPDTLYPRRVRRERERVIAIARYRRAVLLGGDSLARQWSSCNQGLHDPGPEHCELLRKDLVPLLENEADGRLGAIVRASGSTRRGAYKRRHPTGLSMFLFQNQTLRTSVGKLLESREEHVVELRALFAALGIVATQALVADKAWAAFKRRRYTQPQTFTRKALVLSGLCIDLRFARALHELGKGAGTWQTELKTIPPRIEELIRPRLRVGGIPRSRVRQWQEAYNVACVCGIPLLYEDLTDDDKQTFARDAVEWIERATACADSAYVAAQRAWLLEEDRDLGELRLCTAFEVWKNVYFPRERLSDSSA